MDEYDIQRSFEVMDEDKSNRITLKNFHTLYLGLGYQPKQLTLRQLREKVGTAIDERRERSDGGAGTAEDAELFDADISGPESFLPLSLALEILAQHSRDRTSEINRCFQLLDPSNKGYVTATDLQRLSKEVGEPLSAKETELLVNMDEMQPEEFSDVFSPPSP